MDLFDVEAIEVAEAQLDQFIERRAREARDAKLVEVAWAESVRRHQARRREQNRWEWIRFFEHMRDLHQGLADEHRSSARALLEEPGGVHS